MKTEAFPEAIIMLYASKKNENVSYLPLCLQGVSLIYGPYIKVLWNSRFYWVDWIHSGNKKLKHTRIDLLNELFSFSPELTRKNPFSCTGSLLSWWITWFYLDLEVLSCCFGDLYCQLNQLSTWFAFLIHSTSSFMFCTPSRTWIMV